MSNLVPIISQKDLENISLSQTGFGISLKAFHHELYPDLPVPLSIRILSDVATGLSYLHSLEPPILHHNLKPSNVLLDLEYRAKISDFGQPAWRKQQLRAALHNCNNSSCWDLLCLSPEILQGGQFSQEGDVYSFGMMCWELLSRQKPLAGIEAAFIPNVPHRNRLVQLMLLCWHQEPHFRPSATECAAFLKDILGTFPKEMISDGIYNLIHAKECAINAAKGPVSHLLETGMRNLEIICPQHNNVPNKEIVLKPQSLSRETGNPGNKLNQTLLVSNAPREAALGRDPSTGASNGSSPPSIVLPPHSETSNNKTRPFGNESKGHQPPFPQTVGEPASHKNCPNSCPNSTLIDPTCKEKNCSILTVERETILSSMTDGRLNHLLDVLRAQQVLTRADYEMIMSYPTLTVRTRALIDTCLSLGEQAAETVVTVLSSSKGSLLLKRLRTNPVN
ncbi:Receptor-interacting serine/threonine-protein kinase 2, partial [Ophiophagus hannah]